MTNCDDKHICYIYHETYSFFCIDVTPPPSVVRIVLYL